MKIWAVFISCTAPGYQSRWIDTQWATRAKAIEREHELDRLHVAFGVTAHKTTTVELSIVDVALTNPEALAGRWDEEATGYPTVLLAALVVGANAQAVKWIDANCPEHWARPMFTGEALNA